jgi:hypothetical protein
MTSNTLTMFALQLRIPGVEHGGHVAFAELAPEFVPADPVDTSVLRHTAGHQLCHDLGEIGVSLDQVLKMPVIQVKRGSVGQRDDVGGVGGIDQ